VCFGVLTGQLRLLADLHTACEPRQEGRGRIRLWRLSKLHITTSRNEALSLQEVIPWLAAHATRNVPPWSPPADGCFATFDTIEDPC
jgi:hypothetical protein